jgi:hypothetical protein
MAATLLLDRNTWDLCLDAAGNLAIASDPYSIIQDVASACRTFLGEVWYDTTLGIPYKQNILGKSPPPPLAYLKAQLVNAALTVPEVESAVCYIASNANREVTGQIQVTMTSGSVGVFAFAVSSGAQSQAIVTTSDLFVITDSGFQLVTS